MILTPFSFSVGNLANVLERGLKEGGASLGSVVESLSRPETFLVVCRGFLCESCHLYTPACQAAAGFVRLHYGR
jgi:hypothetical protein